MEQLDFVNLTGKVDDISCHKQRNKLLSFGRFGGYVHSENSLFRVMGDDSFRRLSEVLLCNVSVETLEFLKICTSICAEH